MGTIKLGSKVKDKVTGFTGIVTARCEYLNGCIQYLVYPKAIKNEKQKTSWIDDQQLEIVGKGVIVEKKPTGGGFREHPM